MSFVLLFRIYHQLYFVFGRRISVKVGIGFTNRHFEVGKYPFDFVF